MIALVCTYNGRRDCLAETLPSLEMLSGPITHRILVNDTPEPLHSDGWWVVDHGGNRGLAAAVQSGWNQALAHDDVRFVCHWEDDMVLEREVNLIDLSAALNARPYLAQITLQRHGVNAVEAEGQLRAIIAQSMEWRVEEPWPLTVHDHLFSLNPCLIPREVVEMGWPSGPIGVGNEDGMTAKCKEAGLLFATWGTVDDLPYVRHIGHERAASWSL